ncbi:MAG: hypothetical protein D6767_09180 [Candidatus Hydrogenedentota bacterium]|nr:MAG: hypothetical protein D6767_09180 [Candidatus Hydrogenedentota bacterium]
MVMKKLILSLTALAFLVWGIPAQENAKTETVQEVQQEKAVKKETPQAKFKARIYAQYEGQLKKTTNGVDTAKGKLKNEFSIERVYLRYTNYIAPHWKIHATTDIGRADLDANGSKDKYAVFLKYAYAQYGAVKKEEQKGTFAYRISMGMFATYWIDLSDNFRKYRFVSKTDIDDLKIETSSDLGLGLSLFFVDKLITLDTAIQNGEGYGKPESNNYKASRSMLGIHPKFGDWKLSILGYVSLNQTEVKDSHLVAGPALQLAYAKLLRLQASYMLLDDKVAGTSTKGNVLSVFLSIGLADLIGAPLEIAGQMDLYDPDTSAQNDKQTKIIGGLVYRPLKLVAFSVDFMQKSTDTTQKTEEQAVFVHSEFNF